MTDRKHHPDAPAPSTRVAHLGFAAMDRIHDEFDDLLAQAMNVEPSSWVSVLSAIDAHLREHFEAEDRWMTETDFPPRGCHMGEHAAVLQSSREVLAAARAGEFGQAREFVEELVRWFPGHADYLDSALAVWMCKRHFGGRPVVLHRPRSQSLVSSQGRGERSYGITV